MKRRLNDIVVNALPMASAGQYDVWDTSLPGFGVRVGTRRKSFIINTGSTRKALGVYPHISLKEARDRAKTLLYAKYLPRKSLKASDAVQVYLSAISAEKRPNTIAAYSLYLRRIPNDYLHELTAQKLYAVLPDGKGAANLCFNIFKAFLSWCVQRDYIAMNPLIRRRQPHRLQSRERLLTDNEVTAIWRETYNHEVGALLRALILSGQRLNQFAAFDPAWIDRDRITWPTHMMKSGNEHSIPLLPLLKANLPLVKMRTVTSHVERLRSVMDIPHWTPHDFRRYFSSTMASLGTPLDITEAILAHVSGSRSQIQRVYDRHNRLPEMRQAFERYHAHLISITGSTPFS
jgi:integrase